MKRFLPSRRRLAAVGVALATVLGAGVAAAPGAHAAGCYYSSCEGQDPNAAGCGNDAYTIYNLYAGVEVRWSSACQAMWVRASASAINQYASFFDAHLSDYYVNSSGYWLQYQDYYAYGVGGNGSFAWSQMTPMGTNELALVSAFQHSSPYIDTRPA